jgi:hypothetical protein
MVEAQIGSITRVKVIEGTSYKEGDIVLVRRDFDLWGEEGLEEAGKITEIDPDGRVLIDYLGKELTLHEEDQIRQAPKKFRAALADRLGRGDGEFDRVEPSPLRDVSFKKLINLMRARLRENRSR